MDVGLVCDACSTFNPMTAQVCTSCGAMLSLDKPEIPRDDAAPPSDAATKPASSKPAQKGRSTLYFGAMQQSRAKLVLIKGDGMDGISFTLAGDNHVAGRVEGPLLFQEDSFLSPRHADFFYRESTLYVRDEGSHNGIFLRISGAKTIEPGMSFRVGEQLMRADRLDRSSNAVANEDGTYFYASPGPDNALALTQLLRGGQSGAIRLANAGAITMGRENCDINFPEDPFISGRHAQVSMAVDGTLTLTDLGSKNGTFVRIVEETPLRHGDYIFMGQQLLRAEIV